MKTLLSFIFVFVLAISFSTTVKAEAQRQMICAEREQVIATLEERYGESVRGRGLASQNRIIEIFASEETGTWTITMTMPNGMTCLMTSGQHYETVSALPEGDPL